MRQPKLILLLPIAALCLVSCAATLPDPSTFPHESWSRVIALPPGSALEVR